MKKNYLNPVTEMVCLKTSGPVMDWVNEFDLQTQKASQPVTDAD